MVRLSPLVAAALACAALCMASFARPVLVWNASSSVPIGLYVIEGRAPELGEIAALRLPEWASALADRRQYLLSSAILLKPVAAGEDDLVCRLGRYVFMNGRLRAKALRRDKMRRPLPSWKGCLRLRTGQIFVLSERKDSFDSRYFGVIEKRHILGTGRLVLHPE